MLVFIIRSTTEARIKFLSWVCGEEGTNRDECVNIFGCCWDEELTIGDGSRIGWKSIQYDSLGEFLQKFDLNGRISDII